MTRLFVIEAPGKARTLEAILQRLGYEGRVQATRGHLFQMPAKLDNLGIDLIFREFERKPRDVEIVHRLRREAQIATDVFIATDADAEGDVIAWDVAETIRDMHPNPMRVKLTGMDDESVMEALKSAAPVSKRDAVPGRTRAIIDRLIGAGFSTGGVAVGRVGTALLGLVDRDAPVVHRIRLMAPAKDGGRPWVAEADIAAPIDLDMARRLTKLDLPPLDVRQRFDLDTKPANTADIMIRAGDRMDMSPAEVSRSMQRMYEGGMMSYPRAGARTISSATARKMAEVLRKAGYKVGAENYATKEEGDVHDAPYPIGKIDVSKDPKRLGHDEGVRTMVARDLVKAGFKHHEEIPVVTGLLPFLSSQGFDRDVAMAVAKLPWSREVGPRYPGQESWPESSVVVRRPDTVLLERAEKANLGRPSTWGNHIENFMQRGLVDENLRLTAKGRQWIAASPKELLNPRLSAAIEEACEKAPESLLDHPDREPWELNAERIVKALPEAIRGRLHQMVSVEKPHARIDPAVAYAEAPEVNLEMEDPQAAPSYAPREEL